MKLLSCEEGSSAIEYILIAALVAMVVLAGYTFFADATSDMYQRVNSTVKNAAPGATP